MKKAIVLLVLVALLITAANVMAQDSPIFDRIVDRGEMICGANQSLQGFGFLNDQGEFEGFDIDFCKAIAVAVLGDANAVSYRPLTGADRQAAIQGGEVDVMIRNTTWTLSRDTTWGATFGPTTFYDGQGIGVKSELGISSAMELDGASVCVQTGTTTELNISDFVTSNGLDVEVKIFPDANSTWEAFVSGGCEAWTTDKSGIAAFHASSDNPGAYMILPETISKEPLGPLSPQSDARFADIVAWVTFGLIQAEEYGITSENVDSFLTSEDPGIQRFLGTNNNDAGNYLGIKNDFMVDVIKAVGNYGEIYDRHLVPLGLTREGTVNALWTDGGLLYAPPFR
jgi:general L-amino acid transport system substrate-binding protein